MCIDKYVLEGNRSQVDPLLFSTKSTALCNHHFGMGGDGVIFDYSTFQRIENISGQDMWTSFPSPSVFM